MHLGALEMEGGVEFDKLKFYFIFKEITFLFFGGGVIFSWGDFSWEVGDTLPQNIYKPSQDLCEATL